ncbi:MAG: hypothetical protein DDT31_01768 [Syntrophomonadaceae bacterium]|nr:hypothetical protein [Candidatus Psychracetigena formicireducens]MBT9139187.1 hypothetical protein [Bacillota bacterium]
MNFSNDITMDVFLERFRHEKKKVTISLARNDYQIGIITGFNDTLILLAIEHHQAAVINRSMVTYIFFNEKE